MSSQPRQADTTARRNVVKKLTLVLGKVRIVGPVEGTPNPAVRCLKTFRS